MCEDLSNRKNIVFNMGKLLNDGLDLTPAKGQKEKNFSGMRASPVDSYCRKPVSATLIEIDIEN
jgi:hypothetical protein